MMDIKKLTELYAKLNSMTDNEKGQFIANTASHQFYLDYIDNYNENQIDEVLEALNEATLPVAESYVVEKIKRRAELGKIKYQTTTDRNDLSTKEWLIHLEEELLDASIYIQKIKNLAVFEELLPEIEEVLFDYQQEISNNLDSNWNDQSIKKWYTEKQKSLNELTEKLNKLN